MKSRVILTCLLTPNRFVLHIDGKHKLHHGKWMLVSIGTHDLRFDEESKKFSHSYRPLMYMFVKQQETTRESVKNKCCAKLWMKLLSFVVESS